MTAEGLGRLSVSLSVVLLFAYVLYLTFTLVTHPALFAGSSAAEEVKAPVSVGRSVSVLAAATVAIAWMSEIMVSAIEPTTAHVLDGHRPHIVHPRLEQTDLAIGRLGRRARRRSQLNAGDRGRPL
jgi:hypothetical protein